MSLSAFPCANYKDTEKQMKKFLLEKVRRADDETELEKKKKTKLGSVSNGKQVCTGEGRNILYGEETTTRNIRNPNHRTERERELRYSYIQTIRPHGHLRRSRRSCAEVKR